MIKNKIYVIYMQVVKQNNTVNTNQYTTQSKNQNDQYCTCLSPE